MGAATSESEPRGRICAEVQEVGQLRFGCLASVVGLCEIQIRLRELHEDMGSAYY